MSNRNDEDTIFSSNQPANLMSDDAAMDDSALLKVSLICITVNSPLAEDMLMQRHILQDKCVEEMLIDDEPHYRCTECNFISKYRWKTSKHYKANHQNKKLFRCTVCSFTTPNRVDFFSHKATHSSRVSYILSFYCSYI